MLQSLTTKKALAKKLKISERTIHNYHQIAMTSIDEFYEDYPTIPIKNVADTSFPLSEYQVWVLGQLTWIIKEGLPVRVVEHHLEHSTTFQAKFSRDTFNSIQENIHPKDNNHGTQSLLRIA